jgi:protein-L-isoaspartate(D-aspartate) O-methyltransferase
MVGTEGIVIGIDHFHQLRDIAERNLRKSARGVELLNAGNIAFVTGDGREGLTSDQRRGIAGIDDDTKWDVIYVGASAKWIVPPELLRQLKAPGWCVSYIALFFFSSLVADSD